MPARALAGAVWSRRAGLAKRPLGVGRSVLQFVRHLAQLAGDAEIEARSREAAAAFCQLGEKFGVGHTRSIAKGLLEKTHIAETFRPPHRQSSVHFSAAAP
jgi:hypothetical protein